MGVIGGVVAAGAGGDPAAEGGELKALRVVAQREAVGTQLRFQPRPVGPGLDSGGAGDVVNFDDLIQCGQVDGDNPIVAVGRLEPGDGGAAAAVGDGGVSVGGAPVQHRRDFVFGSGVGDDVGRVGKLQVVGADAVAEAAAISVYGALVVIGGADGGEGRGRRDAGRAQTEGFGARRHDRLDRDAVALRKAGGGLAHLLLRGFVLLQTPGPETSAAHQALLLSAYVPSPSGGGLGWGRLPAEAVQFFFQLAFSGPCRFQLGLYIRPRGPFRPQSIAVLLPVLQVRAGCRGL